MDDIFTDETVASIRQSWQKVRCDKCLAPIGWAKDIGPNHESRCGKVACSPDPSTFEKFCEGSGQPCPNGGAVSPQNCPHCDKPQRPDGRGCFPTHYKPGQHPSAQRAK